MANRFPLIVDSSSQQIKELPDGDSLLLGDNEKLNIGDGLDLQLYHDGSNSYINDVGTGSLYIKATNLSLADAAGEQFLNAYSNGGVLLYHNNVQKFETNAGGISVAGHVVIPNDSGRLKLGTGGDLEIFHDGTHNYIKGASGDQSIIFQGVDGSSAITALTLDMANAGNATFNGTVVSPLIDAAVVDGENFKINGGQGSDGQVLTSTGSGVAWEAAGGSVSAVANGADNRVTTFSSADALNGEANLTFNGEILTVNGSANVPRVGPIAQGSGAVQTWDVGAAANTYFVPNNNNTVMNPGATAVTGAIIQVEIAMGSTVYAIAWQNKYKFAGGVTPTVTAAANKTDIFTFRYNGVVWQEIGRVQNLAQTV